MIANVVSRDEWLKARAALPKRVYYNFRDAETFPSTEGPGISAFYKNTDGTVYHTYSAYAPGLENFIGAYTLLDIVPKGRGEGGLEYGMEWLRHKDRYDDHASN